MPKTVRKCSVRLEQWPSILWQTSRKIHKMGHAVFVAGAGIISGIGNNVPETIAALENSKTGVGKISNLRTNHRGHLPASEVRLNNAELAPLSGFSPATSRNVMLSMIAAKEAWDDSGIDNIPGLRIGFV